MLKGKFKEVRKKGFYPLWHNGFLDIEFGDSVRGLNGALPPEMLHFFLLGYFVYLFSGFVNSKRYLLMVMIIWTKLKQSTAHKAIVFLFTNILVEMPII